MALRRNPMHVYTHRPRYYSVMLTYRLQQCPFGYHITHLQATTGNFSHGLSPNNLSNSHHNPTAQYNACLPFQWDQTCGTPGAVYQSQCPTQADQMLLSLHVLQLLTARSGEGNQPGWPEATMLTGIPYSAHMDGATHQPDNILTQSAH